jgi:hypothetical protein
MTRHAYIDIEQFQYPDLSEICYSFTCKLQVYVSPRCACILVIRQMLYVHYTCSAPDSNVMSFCHVHARLGNTEDPKTQAFKIPHSPIPTLHPLPPDYILMFPPATVRFIASHKIDRQHSPNRMYFLNAIHIYM